MAVITASEASPTLEKQSPWQQSSDRWTWSWQHHSRVSAGARVVPSQHLDQRPQISACTSLFIGDDK
jgi:hypothetical protein